MSGTDFTPRGTVNLEFWSKHLESKVFAGFDIILWPKKAGTWKQGMVFTPCNRKSALAIIESGIVRKTGKYKDGKGVRYVLKEGIEKPTKKKRRSSRKPKMVEASPVVVDEVVVDEVVVVEEGKVEEVVAKKSTAPKKTAAKKTATKKKTVAKKKTAAKKSTKKKAPVKKKASKKSTAKVKADSK